MIAVVFFVWVGWGGACCFLIVVCLSVLLLVFVCWLLFVVGRCLFVVVRRLLCLACGLLSCCL